MSLHSDIEALIRAHIHLGRISATGFESVKCPVCNDYKDRAGFNFSNDVIGYNCFNCGISAIMESHVSSNFKNLLLSFGIMKSDIEQITAQSFLNHTPTLKRNNEYHHNISPLPSVKIPFDAELVSDQNSELAKKAYSYLISRGLHTIDFPFIVSNEKYPNRIIIPYLHNDRCVYYQARALDSSIKPRYKNPMVERSRIIFNYNEIKRNTNRPLFVTEGAFDALSIGNEAIAISGGKLSKWALYELKQVRRKIIFVLDKNNPDIGNIALENGWSIAIFPDGITDSNDALLTYGRLWLLYYLMTNNHVGMQAKLLIRMHCKGQKQWKK